jgi:hypothetical protein
MLFGKRKYQHYFIKAVQCIKKNFVIFLVLYRGALQWWHATNIEKWITIRLFRAIFFFSDFSFIFNALVEVAFQISATTVKLVANPVCC